MPDLPALAVFALLAVFFPTIEAPDRELREGSRRRVQYLTAGRGGGLFAGGLVLFPSLVYLVRVFKRGPVRS